MNLVTAGRNRSIGDGRLALSIFSTVAILNGLILPSAWPTGVQGQILCSENLTKTFFGKSRSAIAPHITAPIQIAETQCTLSEVPPAEIQERLGDRTGKLFGMSRDSHGKLVPSFSTGREFLSIRNLVDPTLFSLFGERWNARREMLEIGLTIEAVPGATLVEREDFSALPAPLKGIFRSGSILLTNDGSHPRSEWSVVMATAPDLRTLPDPRKPKGIPLGNEPQVWVLGGRTGFLCRNGVPVVLRDTVSQQEFLVELKGVGQASGGFAEDNQFTIRGGQLLAQAVREDENISLLKSEPAYARGDTVRSAGYANFKTEFGMQAISFRLVPGNIRATFRESDGLTASPNATSVAAEKMGELWGLFFKRGMVPMSHPENMIANADFSDYYMTDLADVLPLGRFPVAWGHERREAAESLYLSINAVRQLPNYQGARDFELYKKGLLSQLSHSIYASDSGLAEIAAATDTKTMADSVFKMIGPPAIFDYQRAHGSVPLALRDIDFDYEDWASGYFSQSAFKARLSKNIEKWRERLSWDEEDLHVYTHQKELMLWKIELDKRVLAGLAKSGSKADYLQTLKETLGEPLSTDPEKKRYGTAYSNLSDVMWGVHKAQRTIIEILEADVNVLQAFQNPGPEILNNLAIATERLAVLKKMTVVEFHDLYSNNHDGLIALAFLPFQTPGLKTNPDLERYPEYQKNRESIQRLFF
jgi:hypothetical protein